jgi:predicted ferric reductase
MNNAWSNLDWAIARSGGFTAFALLALAVMVGLALSLKWQSPAKWPRLINNELHNFLTLLSTIFVGIHVLAIWLDPFTHFGWYEVFIPFLTAYRTFWTSLGIVALYLGIAIGISTLLRPRIGYRWWRRLHVFTLLIFACTAIHGIMTGSDSKTWWGIALYISCILLVGICVIIRLAKLVQPAPKKQVPPPNQFSNQRFQPGQVPNQRYRQ